DKHDQGDPAYGIANDRQDHAQRHDEDEEMPESHRNLVPTKFVLVQSIDRSGAGRDDSRSHGISLDHGSIRCSLSTGPEPGRRGSLPGGFLIRLGWDRALPEREELTGRSSPTEKTGRLRGPSASCISEESRYPFRADRSTEPHSRMDFP